MIFLYPYFLLLFFIPMFFLFFILYSKKRSVFSAEVRKRLSTATGASTYTSNPFLWLFLFALLSLALARPLFLHDTKNEGKKMPMGFLAINLDISKSMLAEDITPNRLEFSKIAIAKIFQKMPDFKLSLNAFSNDIFMVSPFTEDKETLTFLLENLDQDSMTSEGSSIEAVMMGAQKIYEPFKKEIKDVLIVTDGADGLGIEEAIYKAKEYRLRVHLFLVGTQEGSAIKDKDGKLIQDKNKQNVHTKRSDALKELSIATQGVYAISNGSLSDLDWLCEQIRLKSQKEESLLLQKRHAKEMFFYPLALATILLSFIVHSLHVKKFFIGLLPLYIFCFIVPQNVYSGVFDFWDIIKAEELYNTKKHKNALEYFKKVDASKQSDASKYNLANSYYRNNNFKKAIELYLDINTTNKSLDYERLHNLGNAYYRQGQVAKAIETYEKALKVQEEEATQFNLEHLKKLIPGKSSQKEAGKDKESEKKKDKEPGKQQKKNQQSKKDDKKNSQSKTENKMDKKEAQKWEKMLNSIKPKTKPQILIKNQNVEENSEIFW
jgi:Ca-activated chloride channel family protein